jgi:uncharacterized membrane protein AbrB (regulator of aidB expression)
LIFGIIPISINFESIINQIENEVTKMDDLIKGVKIGKILTKDDEKETKKIVAIVLAVIAAVAAVAGVAYAIYRFVNRDYYDDFEDDFEDLFEDEDEDDFEEE